jgi:hypothetical protein
MVIYKVVETSIVTEEALERILNHWVQKGWNLDSIQFVMRDASKRPAMAFVFFVKEEVGGATREEGHVLLDD